MTTCMNVKWIPAYLSQLLLLLCTVTIIIFSPYVMASADTSLNEKALKEVMNGTRSGANASWWGFNEADSTKALQTAIRSKAKKIIVPNMGKPWVVEPIFLESDKEIIFEKGVVVSAKPGAFLGKTESLFSVRNKKNISLIGYGAEFIMRKQDYIQPPYEKGEWRHCITIGGSRNIKIYGLRLSNSGGDGIYIGRGLKPYSENIYIKDVISDSNHRQGISLISASNLLIENSIFQSTTGTAPQAGIDFQPNRPDEVLSNCKVKNSIFRDNSSYGIIISVGKLNDTSKQIAIELEGCQIFENKKGAVYIAEARRNAYGGCGGSILIKNCKIDGKVVQKNIQMLDVKFE